MPPRAPQPGILVIAVITLADLAAHPVIAEGDGKLSAGPDCELLDGLVANEIGRAHV